MAKNLLKKIIAERRELIGNINGRQMIKAIESGYLKDVGNGFKQKKSFSPSALVYGSGACSRRWVLAFKGGEFYEEYEPHQIANMRNGSLSHERIQKAITDAGLMIEAERKIVSNNPPVFGFQDVLLSWEGAEVPGEIKTISAEAFKYRKEKQVAADYHIEQLLIYMHIGGYKTGVIIYENRNDYELLVIPVEMTPERQQWVDNLFKWMQEVHKAYKQGMLPKKLYRANAKACKSCPLKGECDKLPYEGDVVIENLSPLERHSIE